MSTQEALAETTFVYSQGVVGQVTAGLDGVAVKVVAFDRPVDSFGLLEYDEGEARSIAEAAAGRGLGNGLLFEVQARIFHWEFDDGRQKHYVSAHSGRYATEWEMCKRIVPDIEQILAFRSETLEPTHHLMEDGQLKPIQMTQDSIGIVFDAAIPAAQRWNLVSSYEQVQSLDKVVYPEPMIQSSPFPNMWVLNFAAPLSQVRMEQIAAELKQSAAVRLACPVFRQRGYSEEIFEFIFVHALSVEALPGGEIDLDTQFNSDAAIDIVSRRQHASQFPVRYSARIDEGLSASDLIALSNRLYNDAGTKFVSLGKMLISSPLWNGVEN